MKRWYWLMSVFFVLTLLPSSSYAFGSIFLGPDYHLIKVELDGNGYLQGIISKYPIHASRVLSANFNSDRVGWKADSVARGKKTLSGGYLVFRIRNTANNDWGSWTVKLANGSYRWLNINMFSYAGLPREKKDNMVRYGRYTEPRISFSSPGTALVAFGSNVTDGFVTNVAASDILYVNWNSDRVGWTTGSRATGILEKDSLGNYFVRIIGLPNNDKGSFTVRRKDGTFVWFNIDRWAYSANVAVDHVAGQISYVVAP